MVGGLLDGIDSDNNQNVLIWHKDVNTINMGVVQGCMFDVAEQPDSESLYECLRCGRIVISDSHPGECTVCGGGFQNRAMSLE